MKAWIPSPAKIIGTLIADLGLLLWCDLLGLITINWGWPA